MKFIYGVNSDFFTQDIQFGGKKLTTQHTDIQGSSVFVDVKNEKIPKIETWLAAFEIKEKDHIEDIARLVDCVFHTEYICAFVRGKRPGHRPLCIKDGTPYESVGTLVTNTGKCVVHKLYDLAGIKHRWHRGRVEWLW